MFLTLLRLKKTTPPLPKGLWQDPVLGYFETHGKMEFKPGEEYDLTDDEKKAVMERYKIKELLKQRYIEQEFNPLRYKYVEGIVMDPAMFRWYSADMENLERFRMTPKTVFVAVGALGIMMYFYYRYHETERGAFNDLCEDGEYLWWDRRARMFAIGGTAWAGATAQT